jgi:NAD(P)-dependent dehydrogenase (short-subunit alcohol dehydrogenase family)
MSDEQWQSMLDVNLTGTWRTIKAVVPALRDAGKGSIVVIGSVNSIVALPGAAHSTAAKQGLVGLTRSAAMELAPFDIRVNLVAPCVIDTKLNDWQGAYENPTEDLRPPGQRRRHLGQAPHPR